MKYKIHPTLYAVCYNRQKQPIAVVLEAYEWAEEMPIDNIRFMELFYTHCMRAKMDGIVHAYCLAVLNGWAEALPQPKQLGEGNET